MRRLHYDEAIDFLLGLQQFGWKLGLERMNRLLARIGNPHTQVLAIHIAGTNGKGSVTAMLHSILLSAGYTAGMYTSPHLVDICERIRVNNERISQQEFADLVTELRPAIRELQCTFFEAMTAIAMYYFAEKQVDVALYEVGLGGRLDATNVVTPELSIITNIDFDHTQHLGQTLAAIAEEKAGIIKNGVPCVVGPMPQEAREKIMAIARAKESPCYAYEQFCTGEQHSVTIDGTSFTAKMKSFGTQHIHLPLIGQHQAANSCVAVASALILRQKGWNINAEQIVRGLESVQWPGRFDVISRDPVIVLDVAHNARSVQHLCTNLQTLFSGLKKTVLFAVLQDKDYGSMIDRLGAVAYRFYVVPINSPRALPPQRLEKEIIKRGYKVSSFSSVGEAIKTFLRVRQDDEMLCVTGSHYIVGDVMAMER